MGSRGNGGMEAEKRCPMELVDIDVTAMPDGGYYGPCSGRDLPVAFRLFGETIHRFTFCDLAYRGPRATVKGAVPDTWRLISRIAGHDQQQSEKLN